MSRQDEEPFAAAGQEQQASAPQTGTPQTGTPQTGTPQPRAGFWHDLRVAWAERGFRRLLLVRIISQTGDGAFTAGLGTYVFFNTTSFPNPASAAGAFAVLYIPYSLIGPFAGVFIDRWSRRQILVWSAVVRACFVAITATLVAAGTRGLPLYLAALLVLGVNRFFLATLPAATPHVVPRDKLVLANGVAPSAGGIMTAVGSLIAVGVHVLTGAGEFGSAMTLLAAGFCYLMAGASALTMGRDQLGPERGPAEQGQALLRRVAAVWGSVVAVAAGLVAGLRYLRRRRGAAAVLGATGGNKLFYGILFLMSILLYRNYFYPANANSALGHFGSYVVIPGAIGYALAAFLGPAATRRFTKPGWIVISLISAGLVTGLLGWPFSQLLFGILAFGLNVAGQSVAICSETVIQEEVEDSYRGRVFSLYDMMSNVPLAVGAAISTLFMPDDGKSIGVLAVVAVGYLVVAGGYWLTVRNAPPGPGAGQSPAASPSRSAQASSS